MELKMLLTFGNLISDFDLWRGGFRRGQHSAALFHISNENARKALHGDHFACLSDDDGLTHIDKLLKSKYTMTDMGTLGF